MKYNISVSSIMEFGQRKDAQGNPHQEDSMFPNHGMATPTDRLFILCDGMGGHDAGEVASQTVCDVMSDTILRQQPDPQGAFTPATLDNALTAAYDALDAKDTGADKKMGTTMTMVKLYDGGAVVAHIGDSRVYHIRPGKDADSTAIVFQTRDHSLVNDLIAIGELNEEEAKHSSKKNVITRAMMPHLERRYPADVHKTTDIKAGDYFYMCSDGMLEEMEDQQLKFIFSEAGGDDANKVRILTQATKDNRDNHTAFLIRINDVQGEPTADPMPFGRMAQPRQPAPAMPAQPAAAAPAPAQPARNTAPGAVRPQQPRPMQTPPPMQAHPSQAQQRPAAAPAPVAVRKGFNKNYLLIGAVALILVLIVVIVMLVLSDSKEQNQTPTYPPINRENPDRPGHTQNPDNADRGKPNGKIVGNEGGQTQTDPEEGGSSGLITDIVTETGEFLGLGGNDSGDNQNARNRDNNNNVRNQNNNNQNNNNNNNSSGTGSEPTPAGSNQGIGTGPQFRPDGTPKPPGTPR